MYIFYNPTNTAYDNSFFLSKLVKISRPIYLTIHIFASPFLLIITSNIISIIIHYIFLY